MTKSSWPPVPEICLVPARLRVHLAEEVHVHGVVDGDEVVELGNDADVVGVVHGGAHALRGSCSHSHTAFWCRRRRHTPDGPSPATCLLPVILPAMAMSTKAVHIHLGVHAQVLQVGLGDQGTRRCWACRRCPAAGRRRWGSRGTIRLATARSTSVGAPHGTQLGRWAGLSPSTT